MTSDPLRLRRLRELAELALDRPVAEREAFVRSSTANEPALRDELLSLLADIEHDDPRFEPLLGPRPGTRDTPRLEPGSRIGAWRIERSLGEGGMGEVWLAARVEGGFAQRAALKVPRGDVAGSGDAARFARERELLAALDHAGIARLLDGGATPEGRPWFAMEYVEGDTIDLHVDRHRSDSRTIVGLMRSVCDAVAAAHRGTVIHRDIKPSNILVRRDGVPLLLDFGVAGLLDQSDPRAALYATPRFASPEQLRGERVTTASDVFSLASTLRDLLTRAAAPSDADLDAVLACAQHEDPRRRTPTADALGAELDRWLQRRPVLARRPSPWHRFGLFARRNPALATVSAASLMLAIGATVSIATAWRAEHVAHARATAANAALGQRVAQLRELVATLVFGVHDRIGALPGAVPVRAFLVETALRHLAAIEAEGIDDDALRAEIAEVHLRLADVRGMRTLGSLGDLPGAEQSARAGLALVAPVESRERDGTRFARLLARAWQTLGDLARVRGDLASARSAYDELAAVAVRGLARDPGDVRLVLAAATADLQRSKLEQSAGSWTAARGHVESACRGYEQALATDGRDREVRRSAALAWSERALVAVAQGHRNDALRDWQQAGEVLTTLCAELPDDVQVRRDRIEVATQVALTHSELGETAAAQTEVHRALTEARALVARDADNVTALRCLQRTSLYGARVLRAAMDIDGACELYGECETSLRGLRSRVPDDLDVQRDLAETLVSRAEIQRARNELDPAEAAYAEVADLLSAADAVARRDHHAGNLLTLAWSGLGNVALAREDFATAITRFDERRDAVAAWVDSHGGLEWPIRQLALVDYGIGCAHEGLGRSTSLESTVRRDHLELAKEAFRRGLALAERLQAEDRLAAHEKEIPTWFRSDVERVDRALQEFDARSAKR